MHEHQAQLVPQAHVATANSQTTTRWPLQYRLLIVLIAPVVPQLIGSAFNVWYNNANIQPRLKDDPDKLAIFWRTTLIYNTVVYPIAIGVWAWAVLSLRKTYRALTQNQEVAPDLLAIARKRVINLPWWSMGAGAAGWLLCIPVFIITLGFSGRPLNPELYLHLPISFTISGLIAATQSFFAVELLSLRLLYPIFFSDITPANIPGAAPLNLRSRGLLWSLSAGVCPILSLLLLILASDKGGIFGVALYVAGIGILFGLMIALLLSRLVIEPVDALTVAAQEVRGGNLDVHIPLLRADEFGPLIDEFNHMVKGLQEREKLQERFGLHVGRRAAEMIMRYDPNALGSEAKVTVMFVDIREFTRRSSEEPNPQRIVSLLNRFLSAMVEIIEESHGGMVNKFLGDGFMALFGIGEDTEAHADQAIAAGREMLNRLEVLNHELERDAIAPIQIGIGIHTGTAVVGSIGSKQRREYTAIGNTVNIASRVESLTKEVGAAMLISSDTRDAMRDEMHLEALPPQYVKGRADPLVVYRLANG